MALSRRIRGCGSIAVGIAAFVSTILISSAAFAQSDSTPKWDLFAGYQYLNPGGTVPAAGSDPSNPTPFKLPGMARGLGSTLAYNFDPHWAGEVDFGYNRDA